MSNPRRFSLEEDFMKYDTDDLLYGFMRAISTAKPTKDNKYEEYLTFKNFQQEKKTIQNICGVTSKTINNRLNKLIEKGLVKESKIIVTKNDKDYEYPCYLFPYEYNSFYKIIEQEMVAYLVHTRNAQAIRIYLYLLDKHDMKENYIFTVKEIKKALGYSESTKSADKAISDVLESFQKEGLIKIDKEWQTIIGYKGQMSKTERMILRFIATKKP